jgi:hypothetical protein
MFLASGEIVNAQPVRNTNTDSEFAAACRGNSFWHAICLCLYIGDSFKSEKLALNHLYQ